MKVPTWARDVLTRFDGWTDPHQEVEIAEALSAVRNSQADLSDEDWKGFVAEHSAFLFRGKRGKDSVWGTYFAPFSSAKRKNGDDVYFPDIKNLDAESVAHWESRAAESQNPVMRARYADLVWDLKPAITGERPNVHFARIAVDSYLEAADRGFSPMEVVGIKWLGRALDLSLSIKDSERVQRVVEFMFEFYDRVAQPRHMGTWLFLFDDLYGAKSVTAEQEARVIENLETTFAKVTDAQPNESGVYETLDPWAAEAAAERLARHYRSKGDSANVERVIRAYGKAFGHIARQANPMMAMAWLEPVIERYEREGLKKDAEDLQRLAEEKGKNITSDLKTVSVKAEIKQEDIGELVEALIGSRDLNKSLLQIAGYFVPRVDDARNLLEKLRSGAPFLSMIPIKIVETGGFTTGQIGSLDDDPEGRLHKQLEQIIGFYQPLLAHVLAKLWERYAPTADNVLDFLCESPLFADSRDGLLKDGLEAYQQEDFVKAIYVLVPQIEHILRNFLGRVGIPVRKTVRNQPGITDAKNMNDVLADPRMRRVLTENLWRYLAVVYVDRRGLNLRNDLAHGLVPRAGFNRYVADRVFHTLLALSLVRAAQGKPEPNV
ncbi:MAG: DUF4209 domain-containing protein [Candidatus Acidiferrales bacterium]